jgi:hypothetical protein
MTDLISREAAVAAIEDLPPMFSAQDAITTLQKLPSAEAKPVVSGYAIGTDGKVHSWDGESWVPIP